MYNQTNISPYSNFINSISIVPDLPRSQDKRNDINHFHTDTMGEYHLSKRPLHSNKAQKPPFEMALLRVGIKNICIDLPPLPYRLTRDPHSLSLSRPPRAIPDCPLCPRFTQIPRNQHYLFRARVCSRTHSWNRWADDTEKTHSPLPPTCATRAE